MTLKIDLNRLSSLIWMHFAKRRLELVVAATLIVGLGIQLIIAWAPLSFIVNRITTDDAYYYLKPALNLAAGRGLSFDGIHPTNGFQPLWMAVLIPLAFLFRDMELFLRVALTVGGLLYTFAAYLLYRAGAQIRQPGLGWIAALLWMAFGIPIWNTSFAASGMESALYAALLALLFLVQVTWLYEAKPLGVRKLFLFGVGTGLLVLARLDGAIFAIGWCLLVALRNVSSWRKAVGNLTLLGIGIGMVTIPYLIWNELTFGLLFPVSGVVKTFYASQATASSLGGYLTPRFAQTLVSVFVGTWKTIILLAIGLVMPDSLRARIGQESISILASVVVFIGFGGLIYRLRRGTWPSSLHHPWMLPLLTGVFGAIMHILIHSATMWPFWQYNIWHYMPECFLLVLFGAWGIWQAGTMLPPVRRWPNMASVILVIWVILAQRETLGVWLHEIASPPNYASSDRNALYQTAIWLREHTEPDTIGAAWNAGIIGYFSERDVINLDGLANSGDYCRNMIVRPRLAILDYLNANRVRFVADFATSDHWMGGVSTAWGPTVAWLPFTTGAAIFVKDLSGLEEKGSVAGNSLDANIQLAGYSVTTVLSPSGDVDRLWLATRWRVSDTLSSHLNLHVRLSDAAGKAIEDSIHPLGSSLEPGPAPLVAPGIVEDFIPLPASVGGAIEVQMLLIDARYGTVLRPTSEHLLTGDGGWLRIWLDPKAEAAKLKIH